MNSIPREWRESKQSSPYTGKPSARPAGKPGDFFHALENLRRCLSRHSFSATTKSQTEAPSMRFQGMAESIWSDVVSKVKTKPRGGSRAASRWSAPSPGRRTRREDHALTHRPQMSSGRLFLDRVARQHCPSPLHRHPQTSMHSLEPQTKGDILTLPGRGHSYFALTARLEHLTTRTR